MTLPQLVQGVRAAEAIKRDRLIRLSEALRIASVGKSTWYGLIAAGKAPKPVRITPRVSAWSENACLSWVQARLEEANQPVAQTANEGA